MELIRDDNFMTVLSFSQTSHLRIVRATQSDYRSPKLSIIFLSRAAVPNSAEVKPIDYQIYEVISLRL